jgi:hypothetical protein
VAQAKVLLYQVQRSFEPSPEMVKVLDEAIATLEQLPPGKGLVEVYAARAGWGFVADIHDEAILWAEKALDLGEQLGLTPSTTALRIRGGIRSFGLGGSTSPTRHRLAMGWDRS